MTHSLQLFRLALPIILLLFGVHSAGAQLLVPFSSEGGVQSALASARGALGSDAALVGIGTFGNFEYQGQTVRFSMSDGKANLWAYVFRSETAGQSRTIAVVSIPVVGYTAFELPDSGLGVPNDAQILNQGATYFGSGQMVGLVAADTAYMRFRQKYPDTPPLFVTLRAYTTDDSLDLPVGFPFQEQALWTLLWLGGGDSTLACAVASLTGETYCQRIELPSSSVPVFGGVRGTATVTITPNPATDRIRVTLDLPERASGGDVSLILYNAKGRQVRDMGSELKAAGGRAFDLETSTLPPGRYYLRAVGANWVGTAGVVVER